MLDLENTVSKAVAYIEYTTNSVDLDQYQLDHGFTNEEAIQEFYQCLVSYTELREVGLTNRQMIELNHLSMGVF